MTRFERFWLGPADARVYALVRIGYALAALLHLSILWPARQQFFSGAGMIDHSHTIEVTRPDAVLVVFTWLKSEHEVTIVFIIAGLVLFSLMLGLFSRLCAALAFIWSCSYSAAVFPAYSGQDDMFRIFAFLLLISPMGRVWSIDSWLARKRGERIEMMAPRYGLLLMQWQLAMIYFASVYFKLQDQYWRAGEVMPYFLMSMYSRISEVNVAGYEGILMAATYFALVTEFIVPLCLWFRKTRLLGFVLGWGLHGVIGVLTPLYDFSLLMMISYFAFLQKAEVDCSRWKSTAALFHREL